MNYQLLPLFQRVYFAEKTIVVIFEDLRRLQVRSKKDFSVVLDVNLDFTVVHSNFSNKVIYINSLRGKDQMSLNTRNNVIKTFDFNDSLYDIVGGHNFILFDHFEAKMYKYDKENNRRTSNIIPKRYHSIILNELSILIIYNGERGAIEAIDLNDNSQLWSFDEFEEIRSVKTNKSSNKLLVTSNVKYLYTLSCFDVLSGKLLWSIDDVNGNNLIDEESNEVIHIYNSSLHRIDIDTGRLVNCNLKPEIISGHLVSCTKSNYYYMLNEKAPNDVRFGSIDKITGIVIWEHAIKANDKDYVKLSKYFQLENGHQVITSTDPVKQTYIFDPDHPDNIPYRTISNGVHNHHNNPFYKPK